MICWIDWDYPQSAMALHIYRVWRSVPIRSQNPNKSRVKIQLLTRIVCFRPVWPPLDRSDRCRSSGRHNFLIRMPNWMFHIYISIVSTRSMQWCSPIDNLSNFSWPVWPVYKRGLTGLPRLSRKPESCQHMPPLFLGKACVSRNISPNQNCTETMRSTCAPVTSRL